MANPWYPSHPQSHHHYPPHPPPQHHQQHQALIRGKLAYDGDPDPVIPITPRAPLTVRPVRVIGYRPNGEPICEPIPDYDDDDDDGGSFYDEDSDDDDDDDDAYYAEDGRRYYRGRRGGDELRIIVRSRPVSDEGSERTGRSGRSRRPRDIEPHYANSQALSRARSRSRRPSPTPSERKSREEIQLMLKTNRFHWDPKVMREREKRISGYNQTLDVIGNQLRDIAKNEYAINMLADGELALEMPQTGGK
ncbi:hypothetical protein EX30DRAFT_397946 [Ascodesmis nigricans]|uniref:Uncharacterized protein n=1 Tax=Ascodesmis nigricans TaxID=341454 RepID=A0A4S2MM89_9PEZI|nr:hypothetical protein EX30DRAFT_397946 [Ascodesmis nigricans]